MQEHPSAYMLRQTWCILIQVRDCSFNAAWRSDRLGHWDLVGGILEQKGVLNPIFAVPWVDSACFKIDWLHCCDLGGCKLHEELVPHAGQEAADQTAEPAGADAVGEDAAAVHTEECRRQTATATR